jgi:hypothetical protein
LEQASGMASPAPASAGSVRRGGSSGMGGGMSGR